MISVEDARWLVIHAGQMREGIDSDDPMADSEFLEELGLRIFMEVTGDRRSVSLRRFLYETTKEAGLPTTRFDAEVVP